MVPQHHCHLADLPWSNTLKELVVIIGGCFVPWLAIAQFSWSVEQVRQQEQRDREELSVESFFARASPARKEGYTMNKAAANNTTADITTDDAAG